MFVKYARRAAGGEVFGLVWPFVAVVLVLLTLAFVSIEIMSSLRAYIAAESVWSKNEKDAIFFLHLYAETGEAEYFRRHAQAIEDLRHLRAARDLLDRRETELRPAMDELVLGGFAQPDARGAVLVYRIFRNVSYLKEPVNLWRRTDDVIDRLERIGERLHRRLATSSATAIPNVAEAKEIFQINEEVAPLTQGFSFELSETFRQVALLLFLFDLMAASSLMLLTISHVRRLVTQRRRTEEAWRRSEARARATLGSIGEAVIATNLAGHIEFINPAAEGLLRTRSAACGGRPFSDAFSLLYEHSRQPERLLANLANDGTPGHPEKESFVEMVLVLRDGVEINVRATVSRISGSAFGPGDRGDADRGQDGFVIILRNITREREYVRNLAWQASHDSLTGLVNRTEFDRQLTVSLQDASHRTLSVPDVLLLFDLDRFKIVNDTCGHAAGDAMLRAISIYLMEHFRTTDTFARLGGDEFGALLRGHGREDALRLASKLLHLANHFFYEWEAQLFKTSLSIGLLVLNGPDMTAESAMRMTDIACFVAKERGRDRLQEVDLDDSRLATHVNEASWARRLKHALEHGLFCLHAQPIRKNDATAGKADRADKVELLIRMVDPDEGVEITPDKFIPAAERYGLMTAIDRWVVRTALHTLAHTPVTLYSEYAINLSGASVGDSRFLNYIVECIADSGVDPRLLCFEITETAAISNLSCAAHFMNELRTLGCRFALDDFGAGMSSFGYLKQLPIDYVKIDGSFVKNLPQDPVSQDMVIAINDIGHTLGCETIAEYVETEEIVTLLEQYGVDYLQGYFIGRPSFWTEQRNLPSHTAVPVGI
ncbi:EAL domain-containing protein [Robbsia sp. Bb-Pol-6]|uniref:EAL domain-containing protein n=1 Tax=Robbsia betulipollinis TaxID=2981849 RepID=A0ABT3ZID8_9BURK|nr:EAL domain-containing protein [Robbsia betulipollinis]MCY0386182.1 EAL domain-containing protein [Robbsia betulipollinis]